MAPLAKRTVRLLSFRREVDDDALDVAHPVLLQAGEIIGDDLREHRDDALRQIDAGGAAAPRDPAAPSGGAKWPTSAMWTVSGQWPLSSIAGQSYGVVEVAGVERDRW